MINFFWIEVERYKILLIAIYMMPGYGMGGTVRNGAIQANKKVAAA
jgi:hypothetical protein